MTLEQHWQQSERRTYKRGQRFRVDRRQVSHDKFLAMHSEQGSSSASEMSFFSFSTRSRTCVLCYLTGRHATQPSSTHHSTGGKRTAEPIAKSVCGVMNSLQLWPFSVLDDDNGSFSRNGARNTPVTAPIPIDSMPPMNTSSNFGAPRALLDQ